MVTLIVKKDNKIYYMKELTGEGLQIKQGEKNKFLLCIDDRIEPIAIYDKAEHLNYIMLEIMEAIYRDKKMVCFPPTDADFKQEDVIIL